MHYWLVRSLRKMDWQKYLRGHLNCIQDYKIVASTKWHSQISMYCNINGGLKKMILELKKNLGLANICCIRTFCEVSGFQMTSNWDKGTTKGVMRFSNSRRLGLTKKVHFVNASLWKKFEIPGGLNNIFPAYFKLITEITLFLFLNSVKTLRAPSIFMRS